MLRRESLSPERWRRLEPLLDRALDLPPDERAAFLHAATDDAVLRDEVLALLHACETDASMLDLPATQSLPEFVVDEFHRIPSAIGRYEIVRVLGYGGMATVYLAEDRKHQRQVAIKLLHREIAALIGLERFGREIEIIARLSHPHILSLHDSGEYVNENGEVLPFYVMPFVAGGSLRSFLQDHKSLSADRVVSLMQEICEGVAFAHGCDVIHCDLKPENILLHAGHALVSDFGIARAVTRSAEHTDDTVRSRAMGTAGYMSPEVQAGAPPTILSDIFALGCVLNELLPHTTESVQGLQHVVNRATEHNPAKRFASATELANAVRACVTTTSQKYHLTRKTARFRVATICAAFTALVIATYAVRPREPMDANVQQLDANLLAVAPFDVADTALALWREGLVDVLSRNLDGAGPLRTVPASQVLRLWRGRADGESAQSLGEKVSAGLVLYGGLLSAGDSARAIFVLVDTRTKQSLMSMERRDVAARIDRLADSITTNVLRELSRTHRMVATRTTFTGTTSLPALKEFLRGEQFYRAARWDSAQFHFELATHFDSAFAISYHRLASVREWRDPEEFGNPETTALLNRAATFMRRVGPRDSLLLHIDSLRASAESELRERVRTRASRRHEATVLQLLATLRTAVEAHPRDPELALLYANARADHEQWAIVGEIDDESQLSSFDSAIRLDSTFAPAYIRPTILAAHVRGENGALRYMRAYLATAPRDAHASVLRHATALLEATSAQRHAQLLQNVQSLPLALQCEVATILYRVPDAHEAAARLFSHAMSARLRDAADATPECSTIAAAHALMFRGHLRDAMQLAGANDHWMTINLAYNLTRFGIRSVDSSRPSFNWLAGQAPRLLSPDALRWWAADGDTAHIRAYVGHYETLAALPDAGPAYAAMQRGFAQTGRGFLALARHDTTTAIRMFAGIAERDQLCWFFGRETLAALLIARNRHTEAAKLLDRKFAGTASCGSPVDDVLWMLHRARAYERTKRTDEAREAYGYVLRVWKNADAELQPFVTEARIGVDRLTRRSM
ncbi:MAG: serine/threonine-protein kinase [Gemmatimonas sp.]